MLKKEYIKEREAIQNFEGTLKTMEENQAILEEMLEDEITEEEKANFKKDLNEIREELVGVKEYSNKLEINNRTVYINMMKKDLEKFSGTPMIQERMKRQIKMLENLFTLERLNKYKSRVPNKITSSDLHTLKTRVRYKLSVNKNLVFTDPALIEKSLKDVVDVELANKVIYLVYTYILESKMTSQGTYIHFLLMTLSSVNNKEMKDREVVIENIKKIF